MTDKKTLHFYKLLSKELKDLKNYKNPIIVCNEAHRFITAEQLREIKVKPKCNPSRTI